MTGPIQVVLLDDEHPCTETLAMQIADLKLNIEIVAKFNDPIQALDFIKHNRFDILFLDVEMPEMNGFKLLGQLDHFNFDVVFTTAYNQYAIKAFKYSALHYLLKPIDDDELRSCFSMWYEKKQKFLGAEQFRHFLNMMDRPKTNFSRIAIPVSDGYEFIDIDQIIRCQSDNYYTYFYMIGSKELLVCRTLKEVEALLKPSGFIRVHQSHLINPAHIKKYSRHDGGRITMSDYTSVSISKSYRLELTNHLDKLSKL